MAYTLESPEYSINMADGLYQVWFKLVFQITPVSNSNYSALDIHPYWKLTGPITGIERLYFYTWPIPLVMTIDGITYNFDTFYTFTEEDGGTKTHNQWAQMRTPVLNVRITHNEDGSKTVPISFTWKCGRQDLPGETRYLSLSWPYGNSEARQGHTGSFELELTSFPKEAKLLTATSFNDETNPTITYSNDAGDGAATLQAAISLDGTTAHVPYRDIPKNGTSYTFNLTDTERNTLRAAAADATSKKVYFLLKSVIAGIEKIGTIEADFTVVNCNPVITSASVYDANSTTEALTGNSSVFVRYESMAAFSYAAEAKKQATIVSHSVTNGEKTVSNLYNGVIDDVETGTFIFSVTDSRGASTEIVKDYSIINYVKPTCYQTLKAEMSGETGAVVKLKIAGNYYNGSFGAAANTLKLEVRHTQNDGSMGAWNDLTSSLIPVFNGDTYELNVTISGFDYSQSYEFQCRATDKLNVVQSATYTVRVKPVFDWDKDDFNFNVPVNINADTLDMNNETILRHSKTTNNTVLSASGGHIYIRPGGTTDTSSEVRITAQGNIEVKGDIMLNGTSLLTVLRNAGLL